MIARWVAGRGAGRVVLASRRGPAAPGRRDLAARVAGAGAQVVVASCDVADRAALGGLLGGLRAAGGPVTAVVHAAASVRLAPLDRLSLGELAEVLGAKVAGAANLDELLGDEPLDGFVLFSSIAGVWGSGDHGAYAAANAYLDALAQRRRERGLAGTSVAWGTWDALGGAAGGGPGAAGAAGDVVYGAGAGAGGAGAGAGRW